MFGRGKGVEGGAGWGSSSSGVVSEGMRWLSWLSGMRWWWLGMRERRVVVGREGAGCGGGWAVIVIGGGVVIRGGVVVGGGRGLRSGVWGGVVVVVGV
jgi:hypothetical protein